MRWRCHDLHSTMPADATSGHVAIMIDVLRASTTMITALANGAVAILPTRSIDEARRLAAGRTGALLGGERGGVRIEGFDLGNSPLEYSTDRVKHKTIVMTTTNGTEAIAACGNAAEVLVGGIVNRSSVADVARRLAVERGCDTVDLVCAGTDGGVTEEDLLAAGAILDAASLRFATQADPADQLDASSLLALDRYREVTRPDSGDTVARLTESFRTSRGGANLIAIGMESDLTVAASIDSLTMVPRLRRPGREMVPASK